MLYAAPTAAPARGDAAPYARAADHLPLVRQVAERIARRLPRNVDVGDLVSAGTLGLLDALERFDDARGASFPAYAALRVKGAILDELRAMDWLPRAARRDAKKLASVSFALTGALGRAPSQAELAGALGLDERRLERLQRDVAGLAVVSVEDVAPDEGFAAFRAADSLEPGRALERRQAKERLAAALTCLPVKERDVLRMYYLEERTLKDIGAQLGVTEGRVSQLHRQALDRLRRRLTQRAETSRETSRPVRRAA